jgi:hypothetical protein
VSSAALRLARLVSGAATGQPVAEPPSAAALSDWIQILRERFSAVEACGAGEPPVTEDPTRRETDWAFLLAVSLEMAEITYRKLLAPPSPLDAGQLERFRALLGERPAAAEGYHQAPIEPDSALRRAGAIRRALGPGLHSVLFVGDDDAASLALGLLEPGYRIWVVDIDERLLEHLQSAADRAGIELSAERLDLRHGVPFHLDGRFAGVVTDPPRWYAAVVRWLRFAAGCLSRQEPARIFWADHPALTRGYAAALGQLPALGLRLVEVIKDLHRFPPPGYYLEGIGPVPEPYGLELEWLRELVEQGQFWTHLHVLGWDRRASGPPPD